MWGFFADASSAASSLLKTTGPLETVADEVVPAGSSKLAYNESPMPRAGGVGLVEFDMMNVINIPLALAKLRLF